MAVADVSQVASGGRAQTPHAGDKAVIREHPTMWFVKRPFMPIKAHHWRTPGSRPFYMDDNCIDELISVDGRLDEQGTKYVS
jgi:hypothetical protein